MCSKRYDSTSKQKAVNALKEQELQHLNVITLCENKQIHILTLHLYETNTIFKNVIIFIIKLSNLCLC